MTTFYFHPHSPRRLRISTQIKYMLTVGLLILAPYRRRSARHTDVNNMMPKVVT